MIDLNAKPDDVGYVSPRNIQHVANVYMYRKEELALSDPTCVSDAKRLINILMLHGY